MTPNQRKIAYQLATSHYVDAVPDGLNLDADIQTGEGFDAVEDGVWVRAWVKVPASAIPGYQMAPPAPPAVVEIAETMNYVQFRHQYIVARHYGGDSFTEDDIAQSWRNYQSNPSGHFLSKS